MKLHLILATLLVASLAPLAHGADTVTVHLSVNAGKVGLVPSWRDCDVIVPAGANAGDVLDQAQADGCILEWSHAEFAGFGRYVTSIDHVTEALPTFWAFSVDGAYADYGIDGYSAVEGGSVGFTYTEWLQPL
jgi:hypothetical protein